MPQTLEIESLEEFITRHGGNPVNLQSGETGVREQTTWLLCPTGARYSADGEQRQEPSDDPVTKLEGESHYLDLLTRHLEDNYAQCQNGLIEQCGIYTMGSGPIPDESELQTLTELKVLLHTTTQARDSKRMEFETLRGPTRAEQQEAAKAERRVESSEFLRKLQTITDRDLNADNLQAEEMVSEFLERTTEILDEHSDKAEKRIEQGIVSARNR